MFLLQYEQPPPCLLGGACLLVEQAFSFNDIVFFSGKT